MNKLLTLLMICFTAIPPLTLAQTDKFESVTFTTADSGTIEADLFGDTKQAIILAHGAIFNKESWHTFAETLAESGITVLAINFRGYGKSTPGKERYTLYQDILGAIRYLHTQRHVTSISVLGASMGGGAAAQAAISAKPGEIDKLVLLSPAPVQYPEKIQANTLYIVSKREGMFTQVSAQYEKTPEPKQLFVVEGNAHAQHIFKTKQSDTLTQKILNFLKN